MLLGSLHIARLQCNAFPLSVLLKCGGHTCSVKETEWHTIRVTSQVGQYTVRLMYVLHRHARLDTECTSVALAHTCSVILLKCCMLF